MAALRRLTYRSCIDEIVPLRRGHAHLDRPAPVGAGAARGVRRGWLPEPLLSDPYQEPERAAELADSVSMAALLLLERLSPLERAVFVLREVFRFDYPDRFCRGPFGGSLPPAR